MGYSISWIAVRGSNEDAINSALGIRATEEREDIPESSCTAAELTNGWYIVFYNEGSDAIDRYAKQLLSSAPEAIICSVEEHVMCSVVAGWTAGTKNWEVSHESEKGIFHLSQDGSVPAELTAIHEGLRTEQESHGREASGVDYIFDVPIDLAKAIVGFKHDEDPDYDGEDPWKVCEILEPIQRNAPKPKTGCLSLILVGGAFVSTLSYLKTHMV